MARFDDIASRTRSRNLPANGESDARSVAASARWNDEDAEDWRVSLSVPTTKEYKPDDDSQVDILKPLRDLGNRMVFPYTPNIYVTHTANYDQMSPVHTNWPFQIYQNSTVEQFTITGDFTVENQEEGKYWVATTHYLRSVTKMSYGQSSNAGAPPPVVKLNGYGRYVFNDVPVVVHSFNMYLPQDTDYIKTFVDENDPDTATWVPSNSEFTVTVQPAYSRDSVNRFDLGQYIKHGYINKGPGYI